MQFSGTSSAAVENESQRFLMPAAGIYYSNEKYAVGLGFWAPFGLGAKWDLLNTSQYNLAYPKFEFEDDLKVLALQPTFSYKLNDRFSVGVGLTLLYADIFIRKPNLPEPDHVQARVRPVEKRARRLPLSPFDHFLTERTSRATAWLCLSFACVKPVEAFRWALRSMVQHHRREGSILADTYYAKDPGNVKPTLDQLLTLNMITQAQYASLAGA
jgi:hypothetical protein